MSKKPRQQPPTPTRAIPSNFIIPPFAPAWSALQAEYNEQRREARAAAKAYEKAINKEEARTASITSSMRAPKGQVLHEG